MSPRVRGLLYIAFSTVCFAVMSALAKALTIPAAAGAALAVSPALSPVPVPAAEAVFARSLLGWIGLLAAARALGARRTGESPLLLVQRGVFGGLAILCYFAAIEQTHLTTAALIGYAYPVFAIAFAWIFLGERLTLAAGALGAVALAGVGLMCWPGGATPDTGPAARNPVLGNVLALLGSVFSGAAVATLRRLRRDEATLTVVLHFTFWCTVVSLPALAVERPVAPDGRQCVLLAALATSAAVGQLFLTAGYKDCRTSEGSTMSLLNGVFTVLFGLLLFRERLTATKLLGGVLTLGACAALAWVGRAGGREANPTQER